jgi:8-oxo-dGTP pyrophosphatase MutT (NUDIX family)/GNAT superfamily N-acetyltransferase
LYHVTLQKNMDDILENGLKAEHGYQFFDDVPKSTYLTDRRGLPFWKDEIASYYGDPQVVLKVNREGLNLIPDEQGTNDAGAPAYRVEHDIPPDRIRLATSKTADHDLETDSGETYWAGEGNAASGILPVCPQKGTVCLAWRSQYVQSPDCWGTIGGAIQSGKSPQQSAKAELHEETGYSGGINLIPAYVFTDGGFTYHNYIGVVGSQFSFSPKPLSKEEYMVLKSRLRPEQYHQLIPGWETDHIEWVPYATVIDDMNENPEDYHPGMLKLFKNSKDSIERALGIEKEQPEQPKTAAHNPACKCEMCRTISAWQRPWLMGKCHEFALALSSLMPDAQFVAIGNAMFEHVGLRRGDTYYDVRGAMDKAQFAELFGSNENSIHDVSREQIMKDSYPSYIGHDDELVETSDFKLALRTVRKVFGSKTAELLPTAQPPDVRILPCPSGKKKYYDKATILMKERGMNGQPPAAYQCPKCHWWHMTSKPQTGPNPTYRNAAGEQGHLFPSSQDAKFRQWFQGSKVVDANGNPMPVYHGTRSSVNFDTFSVDGPPQVEDSYEGETTSSGSGWDPTAFLGSHFAEESRVANQFAQGEGWTKSRYEGESEAPRVIQVFLRITNPKDFGTESNLHNFIYQGKITDDDVLGIGCRVETGYNPWEGDDDEEVQKQIEQYYQKYENDQAFRAKENEYLMQQYRPMDMEDEMLRNAAYELAMQARHKMEQSGVDGIRYKNEVEGGHAWIAFAPQQIKSVYSQFNPQDQRYTASVDKDADWKRNVLLPAALTLGLGAPSTSPSTLTPQQIEQQHQKSEKAEQQKQLDAVIEAISRAEGAKPERNNPGNITDFNTGEIKTFATPEEGRDALEDQLNRIADGVHPFIKPDMTLREAGLIYSNGDPNWARNVAIIMRVPQHTKMKDLIRGVTQEAVTEAPASGRTGAWLKKAAGFAFRSFKKLWHVGDMKAKSKGEGSLEGAGLSVSVHPEEWKGIAEIGGPTWELTKAGNKFLNFHRLSKQQRKQITQWGVANGYVTEIAIGWRWVYFDSESDEERYLEFETEQEARDEMEGQGEGEVVPAKGSSMKGTDKLKQRTKNPRADDMVVAFDLLVTVYAEEELDCDGVWWEDTFDPASLSAPRGVIFPAKLSSWRAKKIANAKTASAMTFYHGTSAAAAQQIEKEGIKAQPAVWCTLDDSTAYSYAEIKGGDDGDDGALVLFTWDYNNTEPDPEYNEVDAESNRVVRSDIPMSSIRKVEYLGKRASGKVASGVPMFIRRDGGFDVELKDGNARVGFLQIDVRGDTAIVKAIDVDENYQRKGIATKLYAAARIELKNRGIKTLKGALEGSGPVQIREKVFGPGSTKYYHGGDEIDAQQAIKVMDVDYGYTRAETRVAATEWKRVPVTDEWLNRAKGFLKDKWSERHKEMGREDIPTDLKGACKFASLFAQKLFGGRLVGNPDHQVLKNVNRIIDLTDIYDPNTFHHDKEFWMNPEHEESMKSIEPRVQQWVDEFMQQYWNDAYMKTSAADKSWTREQAEALLVKLPLTECGYSAKIVGSIATTGQSNHDLDVLLTPTTEDFDFEKLLKYFNLIGADAQPTYDGDEEIWEVRLRSGQVIDFWFSQEESKIAAVEEAYLYHGTSETVAEKIMLEGVMEAGSYWGTERIAETYAQEAVDAELDYEAEAELAIIRVPISRFNKASLKPDENSVAEPLTYTLKRKEEDLYAEWEQAQGTWQDSLRIYESVRYDAPIQVTRNDRYV